MPAPICDGSRIALPLPQHLNDLRVSLPCSKVRNAPRFTFTTSVANQLPAMGSEDTSNAPSYAGADDHSLVVYTPVK